MTYSQVRYMKIIEKSGYQALPWVRYITQSGGMVELCMCLHRCQQKNAQCLVTRGQTL